MDNKLVSIIIPLYNAEKYIAETLDSVLDQTYLNWECIIIDDGSTDSSKDLINEYCKKDPRFNYYYQYNSGPSRARNYGIKLSIGDYVQFLDADDVILPEYLYQMVKQSELVDNNVILYCDCLLGNSSNIYDTHVMNFPTNPGTDIYFNLMYQGFALDFLFVPSTILFPKEIVRKHYWNELISNSEDWDYYLSILSNNYILHFIDKAYVIYRDTPSGLSRNVNKTIKANYSILFSWAVKKNTIFFYFSKRCALLYKVSIVLYVLKKSNKIIKPDFYSLNFTLRQRLYILLIYPLTLFYLFSAILSIIIKRTKRIF